MQVKWSQFQSYIDGNVDEAPTQAGVYLLWTKLAKDEWRIFYVGEADSLRFKLKQHRSCTGPNKLIRRKIVNCVTGFEYSVQPDPLVRAGVLKFLAQHYRPECGSSGVAPEIEPIEVNLP
jgi:excinuclease UvrABC nuclease subunit